MTYVAEKENKKEYLTESIWHLALFFRGIGSLGWINSDGPLSTKQFARIYRGLAPYISTMQRMGLLKHAIKETIGEFIMAEGDAKP